MREMERVGGCRVAMPRPNLNGVTRYFYQFLAVECRSFLTHPPSVIFLPVQTPSKCPSKCPSKAGHPSAYIMGVKFVSLDGTHPNLPPGPTGPIWVPFGQSGCRSANKGGGPANSVMLAQNRLSNVPDVRNWKYAPAMLQCRAVVTTSVHGRLY